MAIVLGTGLWAIFSVDEQLHAFRWRCPFRIYIPNKPAKYGNKISMVFFADSFYYLNSLPYLGADSSPKLCYGVNQGENFTMELVQHIMDDGIILCIDN